MSKHRKIQSIAETTPDLDLKGKVVNLLSSDILIARGGLANTDATRGERIFSDASAISTFPSNGHLPMPTEFDLETDCIGHLNTVFELQPPSRPVTDEDLAIAAALSVRWDGWRPWEKGRADTYLIVPRPVAIKAWQERSLLVPYMLIPAIMVAFPSADDDDGFDCFGVARFIPARALGINIDRWQDLPEHALAFGRRYAERYGALDLSPLRDPSTDDPLPSPTPLNPDT